MKNTLLIILLVTLFGFHKTQAQGIQFQEISLEQALEKAKAEDKLVFIDFYTTWCAPCKWLTKYVFPNEEVGALYNKEFICISLDAENGGLSAATKYDVSSYPTLMFLNADGSMAYKDTGKQPVEEFIGLGKNALVSVKGEYNLQRLKTEFPNKQNDEQFLKIYVQKIKEFGLNPNLGIEAWLKTQTEVKEDSPEMMEFLLKNSEYLILGGKAEEVVYTNFDGYMDKALENEKKELEQLKKDLLLNTKRQAKKTRSADLLKLYIKALEKQPIEARSDDLLANILIYYSLKKDNDKYREVTVKYIDSLIANNPIQETHKKDVEYYNAYKKENEGKLTKAKQEYLKKLEFRGKYTARIIDVIEYLGKSYLDLASKNEYNRVKDWLKYGYKLEPKSCHMDNLKAQWYVAKGKTKKAIKYKEQAVEKWPESDRKKEYIVNELNQMKKK